METLGFVFGISAMSLATLAMLQSAALKKELDELKGRLKEADSDQAV